MNNQDQIHDQDAEKESGEYALQVADETFHMEEGSVYNTPEVVESVLAGESVVPDEVLPAEEAPKLTAEQVKAINVKQSARIVKGGFGKAGTPKINVTRRNKKISKKAEKTAKASRKKNRQIANKKSRPTGSKKRK